MANPPITLTCLCGKVFTVPYNRRKTAKYCSSKCSGKAGGLRSVRVRLG